MLITRESLLTPHTDASKLRWVTSLIPLEGLDPQDVLHLDAPPGIKHWILSDIKGLHPNVLKDHALFCLEETQGFIRTRREMWHAIHAMADRVNDTVDPTVSIVCACLASASLSIDATNFGVRETVFRLVEVYRLLDGDLPGFWETALQDLADRISPL